LFEQLEKESKISIPKIISTHPLTAERKENMRRIIAATQYEVRANKKLELIFEQLKN
jgi:predicted Zn-dependent protease